MTISDDASRCVSMAFPAAKNNIIRMHCSIDQTLFNAFPDKDNLVTYMPRKLSDHSAKVLFFLREHLPKHWKIKPIDGLDERGVAELLKKSKIFMSFSHLKVLDCRRWRLLCAVIRSLDTLAKVEKSIGRQRFLRLLNQVMLLGFLKPS